jgi:M6 family metalloprotease-like protein
MNYFYKKTKAILTAALIALTMTAHAAFVRNLPTEIKQPDGTSLQVLASGDEHYNWVHDQNNFTIVKNNATGYFVYAAKVNGLLVPTDYIVGKVNPAQVGLTAGLLDDDAVIKERVAKALASRKTTKLKRTASGAEPAVRSTGDYNNIVVYIQFSDQVAEQWTLTKAESESRFNNTGIVSVKDFYKEVSNNQLNVNSTFYPQSNNVYPIAYTDSHPRSYYQKNTPDGYGEDGWAAYTREQELLKNAINYISSQVPASLNIDGNNDGLVDNVVFAIKGYTEGWAELLWPHRSSLSFQNAFIGSKQVFDYNLVFGASLGVGVISHELFHSFGAPDLYQYSSWNSIGPAVGLWDLMASNDWDTPQHMGAYMKQEYGKWTTIPELTASGTYTLQPFSTSTFSAYKIKLPNTSDYLVLEYRKREGKYESKLLSSGLIITMIHPGGYNAGGPTNEVYVFRKDGTYNLSGDLFAAPFGTGTNSFNDQTNPACFKSDGTPCGLGNAGLSNISMTATGLTFTYTSLTTPACATPAWDAALAYTTGQEASYANNKYRAKWWTQNNRPDLNAGSGLPWELLGPCGAANKAPVVAIIAPSQNGAFVSGTAVNIYATATDTDGFIDRVEFLNANNQVVGTDKSAPFEYLTPVLTAGTYTYKVNAYDNLGLVSNQATLSFSIIGKTVEPTIAITSPTPNQQIWKSPSTATPIDVLVTTNNAQVTIDSVLFTVVEVTCNGPGCANVRRFTKKVSPFTLSYQADLNNNGYTEVSATAFSQGRGSQSAQVSFYARPLPELTIVSPLDNSAVLPSATSVLVDVDVSISKVFVDSVVYNIFDTQTIGATSTTTTRKFKVTSTPYDLTLPIIAGKTFTKIEVLAYGAQGKGSASKSVTINYNRPPVITVTAPLPKFNNSSIVYIVGSTITVSANATDADGTIAKVEISQGANAPVVKTTAPYTATFTNLPAPAPDGSIYFTVKAFDNMGATTSALIVGYKNRLPNVAITAPVNNSSATSGSTINIATIANDVDGALAKVEFYNGTTRLGESTTAPYSFAIANAAIGTYTLTAKATDDLGQSTTSSAITVTVAGSTCTVAAWSSVPAYTTGNRVSKSGTVYEAKWWTQNNDPLTNSALYDVWKVIGPCNARLSSVEALNAIALSPMPFSDELSVTIQEEQAHIELYDLFGTKVAQVNGSGIVTISTAAFAPGLYLCKVLVNGESKSFTVVKR